MKLIKQHSLAAALCLACGLNGAQAAINNGAPLVQPLGSGTSGEMFLSVFDSGISTSFAIDLGTTVEDFLASAGNSRYWDLGSGFTSFAALSTDPLIFNVAGNNTYPAIKATNNSVNFGGKPIQGEMGMFFSFLKVLAIKSVQELLTSTLATMMVIRILVIRLISRRITA